MVIRYAADTIRSRNGPTAGYFYCNNEFSVYIKEEQFIELCWGTGGKADHWGDLGVDVWIILGWISRRWDVGMWTELGWPRIKTVGGRL